MIVCEIQGGFLQKISEINNKICFDLKNKRDKEKCNTCTNKFRKAIVLAIKGCNTQIHSSNVNIKHILLSLIKSTIFIIEDCFERE